METLILIAHNIRSCHNIGSIFRTAEGFGASKLILSGYSPYPPSPHDTRMPHEAKKIGHSIHKTALGAEDLLTWEYVSALSPYVDQLQQSGVKVFAVEQVTNAIPLPGFQAPSRLALIVGNEITGIDSEILERVDGVIEIPMFGKKESYNVAVATGVALYHCRFNTNNLR